MKNPWRVTTIAAVLTAGLGALSIVLDTGGPRARDLALLIGAPTLYLLLPATAACFVVALVMRIRRRRVGQHRQQPASRAGRMPV
jgi:hypothetical protein